MSSDEPVQKREQVLIIIWGMLLSSQFVYLAVAKIVTEGQEILPLHEVAEILFVLCAVFFAAATFVISKLLTGKNWSTLKKSRGEEGEVEEVTNSFVPQIIQWVLAESVVIFGLVLTVLGRDFIKMLPFFLGGVILMLVHRPKLSATTSRSRQ